MSVTDAQSWIDYCNGVKHPRREMSPDTLCENADTFVTEDEKNWIINWYDSRKQPTIRPKRKVPVDPYPLALVLKWGYRPVNVERLNEISRQCNEEDEKRKESRHRKMT